MFYFIVESNRSEIMESPSDIDDDVSLFDSQPASPTSLSPDVTSYFEHETLQRWSDLDENWWGSVNWDN